MGAVGDCVMQLKRDIKELKGAIAHITKATEAIDSNQPFDAKYRSPQACQSMSSYIQRSCPQDDNSPKTTCVFIRKMLEVSCTGDIETRSSGNDDEKRINNHDHQA